MARPLKEGMDYFPHDTDASNDEKIEAMEALYGNDGYAFVFKLYERIYRMPDFELDVSDAETIQVLAKKVGVIEERFKEMLGTAVKRKLFDRDAYEQRNVLTSNGIKKRASVVVDKREEMRNRYQKTRLSSVSPPISDAETIPATPQSKVKDSKVKDSKVVVTAEKLKIDFEEYLEELRPQFADLNFENEIKKFHLYWSEGARKLKRPKLALLNWMSKAREIKTEQKKADPDDLDKFFKGKYGHMVAKTKEDVERIRRLKADKTNL